jgi:hypothetical protein
MASTEPKPARALPKEPRIVAVTVLCRCGRRIEACFLEEYVSCSACPRMFRVVVEGGRVALESV